MNLQLTFDEDTKNYDIHRPEYPMDIYDNIKSYSNIGSNSDVIEIGIGTGQATRPFLDADCKVTAIELGNHLAEFVRKKYSKYKKFNVVQTDFMDFPSHPQVDLIYSATAFHWLPKDAAYKKIYEMLKKGGNVALFWNHPYPNRINDISNIASAKVYKKYHSTSKVQKEFGLDDCTLRTEELKAHGFKDVLSMLFHRQRVLDTESYIGLINTYSDHRALPSITKSAFENDMRNAINEVGGYITIYDSIDLYLGRK